MAKDDFFVVAYKILLYYYACLKRTRVFDKDEFDRMIGAKDIKQLGYSETDYVQQLYIEIGNHNHALIPDFVLLPKKNRNGFTAFAVVEAKLSVISEKQLDEAKKQARSYAKLLSAKKISVISKEKIWIFGNKDDFEKCLFEHTISDLTDDDIHKIRNELTKR